MATLEETLARRSNRSRAHDIVLWGATGYTGKLVAEYLGTSGPSDLRWAIGGRNRNKLDQVRRELRLGDDVGTVVGDSADRASLDKFVSQCGVVISTVGPYARHGAELVASCVEHGTDYCDLTGEVQFIRRMIDAHHEAAERSGARIVHCCGYDSIPSDIGCFLLHEHYLSRGGALRSAVMYVNQARGGFSGGTAASMMHLMQEAKSDRLVRDVLRDPYSLNPDEERDGPDSGDVAGVRREAGGWTAPFMMAAVNTRVVRRSNALLGFPYSRKFSYDERMRFPGSVKGMALASAVTGTIGAVAGAAWFGPTREVLSRFVLPSQGDGPSENQRERGMFRHLFIAEGDTPDGPLTSEARVEADQDPGYGATSRMLGEAALCLAFDGPRLDAPGGVLTPAACMGRPLLKRLVENAGMVFDVE